MTRCAVFAVFLGLSLQVMSIDGQRRTFDRSDFTVALDEFTSGGSGSEGRAGNSGRGRGAGAGRRGRSNLDQFLGFLSSRLNNTANAIPSPGEARVVVNVTTTPTSTAATEPIQTSPQPGQTDLNVASLNGISREFEELFAADPEKIAKYVQWSFHQCVGGCDGCLDLLAPDNKGLISTYAEIRRMHGKWAQVVSLADYGILAGYSAYKVGVEKDTAGCNFNQCRIPLQFTSGRLTCSNPDNATRRDFPHGSDENSPTTFLKDAFNLTDEETVALMGGHSLGQSRPVNSGFSGNWDLTPNVLDNGFFQALDRIDNWKQEFVTTAKAHQWEGTSRGGTPLTMLHADMSLMRQIGVVGDNKQAVCGRFRNKPDARRCPESSNFASIVKEYSRDNPLFLRQLASAVEKMSNTATFDPAKQRVFTRT